MSPTKPNRSTTQPTPESPSVTSAFTRMARRRPTRLTALSLALMLLLPLAGCSLAGAQLRASPGPAQQVTPSATAPAGPSVQEVAQTTLLTDATTDTASATCPQGEHALGGGWDVPTQARVFAAQLTGNTWTVSVTGYTGPITVAAYVECLRGVGGATVTQRAFPSTAEPDQLADVFDFCNSGEAVVGGGFDLGAARSTLELQASVPAVVTESFPVGWGLRVMNHDALEHAITLYLECLSNVQRTPNCINLGLPSCYTTPQPIVLQQTGGYVYSGEAGKVTVSCAPGTIVVGGGLTYTSGQSIGNLYLLQAVPGGWQGAATVMTGFGLDPVVPAVRAICLIFS